MCLTMGWSSPITKHDYTYNVLILSYNQTWLHMTLCLFVCLFVFFFFWVIALSHAHNCTHKKKRIEDLVCIIWKDWTYLFKTGRLVIGLHSNACLLRPLISAGLHKRGVRSLGDVQWGGMFTLHPSWRSVPILWEGPGSQRTTAPLHSSFFGKVQLWVVVAGQEREREREREVRWWRWWSAAAAARRRRRRRRTQETGGVCRMGCVDSKAISWSFVQERGGFI